MNDWVNESAIGEEEAVIRYLKKKENKTWKNSLMTLGEFDGGHFFSAILCSQSNAVVCDWIYISYASGWVSLTCSFSNFCNQVLLRGIQNLN